MFAPRKFTLVRTSLFSWLNPLTPGTCIIFLARGICVFPCPAQNFEEAKRALGGFHFVAIQSNPDADDVAGFWLLKEVKM